MPWQAAGVQLSEPGSAQSAEAVSAAPPTPGQTCSMSVPPRRRRRPLPHLRAPLPWDSCLRWAVTRTPKPWTLNPKPGSSLTLDLEPKVQHPSCSGAGSVTRAGEWSWWAGGRTGAAANQVWQVPCPWRPPSEPGIGGSEAYGWHSRLQSISAPALQPADLAIQGRQPVCFGSRVSR